LIADHLDWFSSEDLTQGGRLRTIEDILRDRGELVKRGVVGEDLVDVEGWQPAQGSAAHGLGEPKE
jgi:hypothetical protein